MRRVALAAGSRWAAEAGAAAARRGGNAVDAAVAATFVSWVCEPALTSLGSGGFCTVWPAPRGSGGADSRRDAPASGKAPPATGDANAVPGPRAAASSDPHPVTIDGFIEMPGRSAPRERLGRGTRVTMSYGGGAATITGPGSIGTPGALAAVEELWRRWGTLAWSDLIRPAIIAAREGFPLPAMSHRYFLTGGAEVLSQTEDARRLVLRDDGSAREAGESIRMPELADTLAQVAADGAAALYRGSLGRAIADWVTANGGLLGRDDLTAYRVIERRCFEVDSLGWRLACNPSPAVGGRLLVRILQQMDDRPRGAWTADDIAVLAAAMERAFAERTGMLASDAGAADRAAATAGGALPIASPATSHTSAVDSDGLAVAITTSTGYSSGVIVPGTGILLNNTLGELELCPGGYHALKPGERLRSNMNPTVARRGTAVLAFGAAGADRIASAMAQVWLTRAALDRPIEVAVAQPRCHVERHDGAPVLAFEPGVETGQARLALRPFESPHMYFGGVQAAERGADGRLAAAADPRRDGAAVVVQGASPGLISGSSSAGAIP